MVLIFVVPLHSLSLKNRAEADKKKEFFERFT